MITSILFNMRYATTSLVLATVILNANEGGASAKSSKSSKASRTTSTSSDIELCTNENCVGDDTARCEAGGGECTSSLNLSNFIKFIDPQKVKDKLVYGKYCGTNKCSLSEGCTTENQPDPCDSIDAACMVHDSCVDVIADGELTDADRLKCDSIFVSALHSVFKDTPLSTKLCEDSFYDPNGDGSANFLNLVSHESLLVAAPFCCSSIIPFCKGEADEPTECDDALVLCKLINDELNIANCV